MPVGLENSPPAEVLPLWEGYPYPDRHETDGNAHIRAWESPPKNPCGSGFQVANGPFGSAFSRTGFATPSAPFEKLSEEESSRKLPVSDDTSEAQGEYRRSKRCGRDEYPVRPGGGRCEFIRSRQR